MNYCRRGWIIHRYIYIKICTYKYNGCVFVRRLALRNGFFFRNHHHIVASSSYRCKA